MTYVVFVTLDVRPERIEEFLEGIAVNAEASLRDEPGCLRFEVLRSADVPGRFHFDEVYRDRDAFEIEHRSAPHYEAWREVAARCVVPGSHHNLCALPADDRP